MDNDVQMRGLVWQSMQLGPSLQRRGKGMHERLLDEVPPGPGHVSEVQYLFKLFLVWVSVFHFTLGLVRINGALIQLLPLKLMLDSHSGICGATPFFALGILSAALLAMRERDPISSESRATTTTHILPLTDRPTTVLLP